MFILQKLNVVKIVDTTAKKDELIHQGFAIVQTLDDKNNAVVENKYEKMRCQELRKYAMSKGIDVAEKKKAEIIAELQKLEG
jgi:hypothetical protein